jgi:hypothetical protein
MSRTHVFFGLPKTACVKKERRHVQKHEFDSSAKSGHGRSAENYEISLALCRTDLTDALAHFRYLSQIVDMKSVGCCIGVGEVGPQGPKLVTFRTFDIPHLVVFRSKLMQKLPSQQCPMTINSLRVYLTL